jgi:uncharacterized protein (TIRG00374 family)
MLNKLRAHKRRLILFIKIVFAAILIYLLLHNGMLDLRSITIVSTRLDLFLPALLCLFFGIIISGIRWWFLLAITGNKIHLRTVLSLQLIGSFFSAWLPGAVGGDAIRGIQIFRLLENGRSTALFSIIADRAFAMFGLVSVAGCATLFLPAALIHNAALVGYVNLLKILSWGSGISLVVTLATIWLVLRFSLLKYAPIRIRHYLHPIAGAILTYAKAWPTLILCAVISSLASGIVVVGIVLIAEIFTYAANPIVTAIAGVFGNLFSVIPITPGGLGVGESIFSRICTDLSGRAAPFATIYFIFRAGMLIVNIPGMLISLQYNHAKHRGMARSNLTSK